MPRNRLPVYSADNPPPAYLSTSGGMWRLIYQGMPLCCDQDETGARLCARQFKYDPAALPVWDGAAGKFSGL